MTIDLTDTTTGAITSALTEARRRLGGQTTGMVLTLVIVTDEAAQYDAIRAANQAAREHPCRVLAIITRRPKAESRLDAEIRVGESSPGETIVLRMYGPLGQHADSVAAPLLVPDVPVVTWWPENAPEVPSRHPLGALAQRRVTDAAAADDPRDLLAALARAYKPGDTDFAWTRATPWRSLLAATLDQPHPRVEAGEVRGEADNPTADLITAWLGLRLGIPVKRVTSGGPGITGVTFATAQGDITISRPDGRTATLAWHGRPDRMVALHRRETAELLAEELRRLDPDPLYAETLARLDAPGIDTGGTGVISDRAGITATESAIAGADPDIYIHDDGGVLARAAAARVIDGVADAIAVRGRAHVVLTGGGIGTKVLTELAAAPGRDTVDWRLVDFWWGDERFVPADDPERNEKGARDALLSKIAASPARVHVMRGPDGPDGDNPEAAAARYAAELNAAAEPGREVPAFDIAMFGIGPEGHVASLFPDQPAVRDTRPVVAVHDSPKPPPTRISLTFGAIEAAREVWILASGAEKAEAVAAAASGTPREQLPAAGARGTERTLFLIDEAAAGKLGH
ncbi:MAG TPA: 6-phosphogluconolactonase [Trebonia sp.]|jgi:glucose-6-phosphate dehydrogenase assembly protein OpcA